MVGSASIRLDGSYAYKLRESIQRGCLPAFQERDAWLSLLLVHMLRQCGSQQITPTVNSVTVPPFSSVLAMSGAHAKTAGHTLLRHLSIHIIFSPCRPRAAYKLGAEQACTLVLAIAWASSRLPRLPHFPPFPARYRRFGTIPAGFPLASALIFSPSRLVSGQNKPGRF